MFSTGRVQQFYTSLEEQAEELLYILLASKSHPNSHWCLVAYTHQVCRGVVLYKFGSPTEIDFHIDFKH